MARAKSKQDVFMDAENLGEQAAIIGIQYSEMKIAHQKKELEMALKIEAIRKKYLKARREYVSLCKAEL